MSRKKGIYIGTPEDTVYMALPSRIKWGDAVIVDSSSVYMDSRNKEWYTHVVFVSWGYLGYFGVLTKFIRFDDEEKWSKMPEGLFEL